jgi:hypothetical protein
VLSRTERRHGQEAIAHLPEETMAHIQSAGCKKEEHHCGSQTGVGRFFFSLRHHQTWGG